MVRIAEIFQLKTRSVKPTPMQYSKSKCFLLNVDPFSEESQTNFERAALLESKSVPFNIISHFSPNMGLTFHAIGSIGSVKG